MNKPGTIRAAVLKMDAEDFEVVELPIGLKGLQGAVGGLIELLPLDLEDVATVFVNEEGKIDRLTPTAAWVDGSGRVLDVICGPIVILGAEDGEGDSAPVTAEAIAAVKRHLWVIPAGIRGDIEIPEPSCGFVAI